MTERKTEARAGPLLREERRRPGRIENVSEELLPLLRGAAELEIKEDATERERIALAFDADEADQLRGAKGIFAGALIGLAFWLGCFTVVAVLLGR